MNKTVTFALIGLATLGLAVFAGAASANINPAECVPVPACDLNNYDCGTNCWDCPPAVDASNCVASEDEDSWCGYNPVGTCAPGNGGACVLGECPNDPINCGSYTKCRSGTQSSACN